MRSVLTMLAVVVALAGPARGDGAAEAVQGVISRQIAAFLADDVATAFSFASPGIQRLFGTPERFGEMVRNGYPMVWRPGDVRFLGIEGADDARRQIVEITDGAGRLHRLEYSMIRTGEGWRIDGVRFLPAPPPLA